MSARSPSQATSNRQIAGMPLANARIVLLHESGPDADKLKNLIEFMDAPQVTLAEPDTWAEYADGRVAALFISSGLGAAVLEAVFAAVEKADPNAPLVVCGGEAADAGRYPWARLFHLANPLQIDELAAVLEEVWAARSSHRGAAAQASPATQLIGDSADMQMIRALIERVAPSQATVLVTGESGTGKELIARQVHEQSGRKGEFVAINCGAIPDHLLESELFGHEKGAFTGAHAARSGRIEHAEGGTLFLDEIGDMPTAMQVKLLRVLQERVIERVGGTSSIPVDIRVVAATHRNLQQRIDDGRFREDLFYRLNVFPIEISPLGERPEDVAPLAEALIERVAKNYGVRVVLSEAAMQALCAYAWPGNVRELANLIERLAVIRPHAMVEIGDLPAAIVGNVADADEDDACAPNDVAELPASGLDLKEHLAGIEREMIAGALQDAGGVVQKAAKQLGLGRTTLVEKIRRHELRD